MSLFHTFHTPGDFAPLFRLLDDYDFHRSTRNQASSVRSFAPRFDVRETNDAYLLDGELPGIANKDIEIELKSKFLPAEDSIKHNILRTYHSLQPPAPILALESSGPPTKLSQLHKVHVSVFDPFQRLNAPGCQDQKLA